MTTSSPNDALIDDTANPTDTIHTKPERLWAWVRERPSIFHAILLRENGPVIDSERLSSDEVFESLSRAARVDFRDHATIPSCARLADVNFRLVGVREPATMVWRATVDVLELDPALKALGMTLTIHASRPYRGTGERTSLKGHVVVPYSVTCPAWMRPYFGSSITAPNEEDARRRILRAVRLHITTMLSERERSCEDLTKRIEALRAEALVIVDALSLIDRNPERA